MIQQGLQTLQSSEAGLVADGGLCLDILVSERRQVPEGTSSERREANTEDGGHVSVSWVADDSVLQDREAEAPSQNSFWCQTTLQPGMRSQLATLRHNQISKEPKMLSI